MLKNIDFEKNVTLKDEVMYQNGQVVSKTLVQNPHISITLFAFDKDEEISTHSSHGDAMVTVLDGVGRLTIGDTEHVVSEGETIIMPAEIPHAVYALEQFKMLLTVVF